MTDPKVVGALGLVAIALIGISLTGLSGAGAALLGFGIGGFLAAHQFRDSPFARRLAARLSVWPSPRRRR
ncbi:MAG: hypothetical protein J2P50_05400 [Hyphomicrobiaceae bacterium]|nr:hypothetical protein [Hyphomicrobiaceae bacterium]